MRDVTLSLVETTDDAVRFERWLHEPRELLGVDTETSGFDWTRERLRTVQFGDAQHGWCIPVEGPASWGALVARAFATYRGPTVWQNLKFDAHFLREAGQTGVRLWDAHDTRIMGHLHDNEGSTGLKPMAARYVDPSASMAGVQLDAAMKTNRWGWGTVPLDYPRYWQYAALDPVLTVRVAQHLLPRVQSDWADAYDVELACQQVLISMEQRGMRVDRSHCSRSVAQMRARQQEVAAQGHAEYGIDNINSNARVIDRLIADGVALTKRTDKGALALDDDVLTSLEHPLGQLVREWRHLDKIASTYFENFLEMSDSEGILHPTLNLLGAKTSRMSVSKPSLQNLERSALVRNAFVPREGRVLLLVDYDQIELRLLAHFAQERSMMEAVFAGHDLHTEMCRLVYNIPDDQPVPREKRQLMKNGNFAKLYGAGIKKFAQAVHVGYAEAEAFLKMYDERFPTVRAFQSAVYERATRRLKEEGRAYVTTWLGRQLSAPDDKLYTLVNYLIQGTAAEIFKHKLVELDVAGLSEYLVLPVHDEFVFDVPASEVDEYMHEVKAVAESNDFSVPLTVGTTVVHRWGDKYKEETA